MRYTVVQKEKEISGFQVLHKFNQKFLTLKTVKKYLTKNGYNKPCNNSTVHLAKTYH